MGLRAGTIILAVALWGQPQPPAPGFHHLHLNSVDPEAAIAFYVNAFPATSRTTFAGQPALASPNGVLLLFNKVATPPPTQPHTAFWHFGWHVTDVHAARDRLLKQRVTLLPLYTGLHPTAHKPRAGPGVHPEASSQEGEERRTVAISSDTWPGSGGVLGLTRAGIADARAKGITPTGGPGFAYLRGPDDALVEYQGNMAAERFNHVHMFHDQPFCAQLWYQNILHVPAAAKPSAGQVVRTTANCAVQRGTDKTWPALDSDGMYRTPAINSTVFGGVSLFWYMNQHDTPAASTRGHLMDHIALSVTDLDAWLEKLRAGGVLFLEGPYRLGDHRAVMIEGPSKEAIELVELPARR
jgi:catechol 2,3-dioxygenase-like lactoylglutathione lyase family enzyme